MLLSLRISIAFVFLNAYISLATMLCPVYSKEIGRADNYKRHMLSHKDDPKAHKCGKCKYATNRSDNMRRHALAVHTVSRASDNDVPDDLPQAKKMRLDGEPKDRSLRESSDIQNSRPPLSKNSKKGVNLDSEASEETVTADHNVGQLHRIDNNLESEQDEDNEVFDQESALQRLLIKHEARIKTYSKLSKRVQNIYNFQLHSGTSAELTDCVRQIFSNEQQHPFKLNVSLGFVLQDFLTGQLVYYYASQNNRLLPRPSTIQNPEDVETLSAQLDQADLLEYARQQ